MAPFANSTSNLSAPASNNSSTLDKLLQDETVMQSMTDARIILTMLLVVLGIILKAYQIRIAKSTLDVLRDIKVSRIT
ncbi:hypothetical protein LTR56_016338 [Elasticomyces elasticus]|nr:hypothetical protein LTR56_016338 [Elasticomyces elasticus]KAK3657686.1 hypothetical protein LTR22_009238 [Elasticomyces elasticus]KAK4922492.1 hypothetical protein LTR49_010192 [Elasticomyces elasticus]KAK5760579.1 hypothetical protein LTS12_009288 [Elasticomyces elasticus]